MTEMIGKCGVLCSSCPWSYEVLQNYRTDEEYVEFITKCKKVLTYSPPKNPASTAWRDCPGCLTPREECSPDKRIPLRACVTYECVHKSGMENCAYCSRYPCAYVKRSFETGWNRKNIEAKRGKPMTDEEYQTFVEPFDVKARLDAIHSKLKSDELIDPISLPIPKGKIVAFPENLTIAEEDKTALQKIHQLITHIQQDTIGLEDADLIPQQARLKQRRKHLLRFLWVFGSFGEIREDNRKYLLIEPGSEPTKYGKATSSESQLRSWDFLEKILFPCLAKLGVQCEIYSLDGKDRGWLTPKVQALKVKGWEMKISFDEKAGSTSALKMYGSKLVDKYGKRSFSYFTKADMRVLLE